MNFGDLKIYYPDGTLLGFQPWVSETGSFPIGPNENGNWPETNGDEALFAAAGYHDIKNIVIVTVIDMSAEMADDADKLAVAIKSAKEQNTDNNKIRLETNNRSFFINKENLMDLTCEYISPTGACIFLDVDDVKIRGIISKDGEYSYNMGYNTAPWAWLSEVNGQVTQWLMKPDNESGIIDRMSVQIGGEEENIIAYPSAGRLVAITPEVLPANTIVKGTYGDRLSWDAYFQVDLKENMLVGKAGSEFDNSLIQSPGPGPDMIFNSGKTGAYLSDEIKIGVTNYLSSLVKVPNYSSTQMKTLPECAGKVAVDLPDWAADLPKKRGLSR